MSGAKKTSSSYKRADLPQQKDERRQLILHAAIEEFTASNSIEQCTIDAIARRAGLAKGTVYLYFQDKNTLFRAILDEAMESHLHALLSQLTSLPSPVGVKALARAIFHSFLDNDTFHRIARAMKGELNSHPPTSFAQKIEPLMNQVDEAIVEKLPGLKPADGHQIMMYSWALLSGLNEMPKRPPKFATPPNPSFAKALTMNLDERMELGVTLIIEGFLNIRKH
jgi:AcrR family transcriptional regulator